MKKKTKGQRKAEAAKRAKDKRVATRRKAAVAKEKEQRATECLKRMEALWEELNCTVQIVTILSSTPGAKPVHHEIKVFALDWPTEDEK